MKEQKDPRQQAGGRVAAALRWGSDPTEARAELALARIEVAVQEALADAPPLTVDQKARIHAIVEAQVVGA